MTTEIKKKRSKNEYFNKNTELAIIQYNSTLDIELKNKIYESKIHYSFFKLTQNLIHTFKYYHTEVDNLEDLQHETIIFLISKLGKFDATNGAKAFSYFQTVAKRYLILRNKQVYTKKLNTIPIDTLNSNNNDNDKNYTPSNNSTTKLDEVLSHENINFDYKDKSLKNNVDKLSDFMDRYIDYCTDNIYTLFPKEQDAKIADAILELFRKRSNIEIFNKKALYIYIKEIIDVKAPKITKISNVLNNIFKKEYSFYLENDEIRI
jgi:hypothetical protein